MAQKVIQLPEIGDVVLQKRKGNRSLRISIGREGVVKVTLPTWAPYEMARQFALSKAEWIAKHRPQIHPLGHKTRIGKAHELHFYPSTSASSARVTIKDNQVRIVLPHLADINDQAAQSAARRGAIKALKKEAEQLLPGRVYTLAQKHGFTYNSVSIKRLSTRWGSCDHQRNIILNCYLMQLPWHLIDYVLLHELTHTRVMAHGSKFWEAMAEIVDDLPSRRKEIRSFRPDVIV